ncbi:MAG: hypothetical protein QOE57_736 [Acidimicrobiaceae bacterium]|nr:hypothetical protein [Acidimicrobiaceae bacterium]
MGQPETDGMATQIPYDDECGEKGQEHHDVPDPALSSPLSGDDHISGGRSQNLGLAEG